LETVAAFFTALAPIFIGPAGGLITVLLILFGGTYVFVTYIIPIINGWITGQDKKFESMIDEHRKDRRTFEKTIDQLVAGLSGTNDRVAKVEKAVEDLDNKLGQITIIKEK
jgi:hypothetical protein